MKTTAKHEPIFTQAGARALLILGGVVAALTVAIQLIEAHWSAVQSTLELIALSALFVPGWALLLVIFAAVMYGVFRSGGDGPSVDHH